MLTASFPFFLARTHTRTRAGFSGERGAEAAQQEKRKRKTSGWLTSSGANTGIFYRAARERGDALRVPRTTHRILTSSAIGWVQRSLASPRMNFIAFSHSSCSAQFHCNLIPICRPKLKSNWILIHCAISAALSWYGLAWEADETVLGTQTFGQTRNGNRQRRLSTDNCTCDFTELASYFSLSLSSLSVLFPPVEKYFRCCSKSAAVCATPTKTNTTENIYFFNQSIEKNISQPTLHVIFSRKIRWKMFSTHFFSTHT